eukprot:jgi/Chlat1/3124/Chrsp21S03394
MTVAVVAAGLAVSSSGSLRSLLTSRAGAASARRREGRALAGELPVGYRLAAASSPAAAAPPVRSKLLRLGRRHALARLRLIAARPLFNHYYSTPTLPATRACTSSSSGEGVPTHASTSVNGDSSSGEERVVAEQRVPLSVVLVEPKIPGNTGSVARTCAAAGVGLHLVGPLGFTLTDTQLKRAGLDYWPYVCVEVHDSWQAFEAYFARQPGPKRLVGFSARVTTNYTKVPYRAGDWLLFGSETDGLPKEAMERCRSGLVTIPICETHVRSLNLAVAAGIGTFEALRQIGEEQEKERVDTLRQDVREQHAVEAMSS